MNKTIQAIGFKSASSEAELFSTELAEPKGYELQVKINAIAVNPVDTKVKASINGALNEPKIIGWDAVGTVEAVGDKVSLFKVGDTVFYAGDVTKPGCYASHQLVDERIAAIAPKSISTTQAAALPLTSITAWESLFSRLRITEQDAGKTILLIGAAGGVGSIATQLAKQVAHLTVVATASRPETIEWCNKLGADHVINHQGDLVENYRELGIDDPDYILCMNDTDHYYPVMAELIAPQGLICTMVTSQQPLNYDLLKNKSAGLVWEFMFTRPMFNTNDMIEQHKLLTQIAELVDAGKIISTQGENIGPISAESIHEAHQQLVTGTTIGKITLTGMEL
jgi:zinc-binding alcohol dehydrogenase family protein